MADNVQITAGSGTTIAADDVGAGVLVQRVKPAFGADGSAVDVSPANPMPVVNSGTEVDRLELLAILLRQLLSGAGGQMPDPSGRTRVTIDAGTLPSVTGVGTVSTVSTVNNVGKLGGLGFDAGAPIPAQYNQPALMLRDRITVT